MKDCQDTIEVPRIGIVYCMRKVHRFGWHKHRTSGIIDARWKRNPLRTKIDRLR